MSDTSDGSNIISQRNEVYTPDDTAYVRWQTPSVPKEMSIIVDISYPKYEYGDNGDVYKL